MQVLHPLVCIRVSYSHEQKADRQSVEFASMWFNPLVMVGQKIMNILNSTDPNPGCMWELLAEWDPKWPGNGKVLQALCDKNGLKHVATSHFTAVCHFILHNSDSMEGFLELVHPTARMLIKDFKRLSPLVPNTLVRDKLFEELVSMKFKGAGTMSDINEDLLQIIEQLTDKEKHAAGSILAPHWGKTKDVPAATASFLTACSNEEQRKLEHRAQMAAKTAEAKAAAAKVAETLVQATSSKLPEPTQDQKGLVTQPQLGDGNPPNSMDGVIVEGDIVRTKATKHKDKYNDKQGKVEKVLAKKVRVLLLEGPANGTCHDFTFDSVTLVSIEGQSPAPDAGLPVSADSSAALAVAPAPEPATSGLAGQDEAAKLAASLFGDAGLAEHDD